MSKRIWIFLFILIILFGMAGCGLFKKSYTLNETNEMVFAYLENKYGEEFVVKSIEPSSWAYSNDKIYCYSKKGTEEDMFIVWGTLMDDGTYRIP